ncbi:TraB/GumN family protein [Sphingomonas lenta]|uniref:TraB/GumN family protein n=1 Tax=Sphingomonas lenta TaxID=1141887 RepID=A0A2A2SJP4_9SPHN|nr:TraB/GumN family protein [Sphingomonas lenta]PAX09456.1 TraB/GumN family protein [Sphingomonas lenta]
MPKLLRGAVAAALAFAALPACAQVPSASGPAATADADPALWVVKDADTTVYLFGTVHVLKPGMSWFDEAVKTAFDGSKEVVLEIADLDPKAAQQVAIAKGLNMSGPGLTEKLPVDKRAAVTKALTDLGLPQQAYDRMDPWLAAVTLVAAPLEKLGFKGDSGAEKVITASAKGASKQLVGLETIEQQLGYFDSISEPEQVKFLVSAAEDLPQLGREMERMIDTWARGDADGLAAIMNENLKDSPEVARILLTNRNKRWAEWINGRMAQPGTVFVAVGAGHLAGAGSVQDQLKAYKLRATRVKY